MKKLALALMAIAATAFGTGLVVNAYPPGAGVVTASPTTLNPDGTVTVTGSCLPGEGVTVVLEAETEMTTCGAAGTAPAASMLALSSAGGFTVTIAAPTAAGTYVGTATGATSGALGSFTVVVASTDPPVTQGGSTNGGGTLPSTGSDGVNTAMMIGIGSLLIGLGLLAVAQIRRRQDLAGSAG